MRSSHYFFLFIFWWVILGFIGGCCLPSPTSGARTTRNMNQNIGILPSWAMRINSSEQKTEKGPWLFGWGIMNPTQLYREYFINHCKDPVFNQPKFKGSRLGFMTVAHQNPSNESLHLSGWRRFPLAWPGLCYQTCLFLGSVFNITA